MRAETAFLNEAQPLMEANALGIAFHYFRDYSAQAQYLETVFQTAVGEDCAGCLWLILFAKIQSPLGSGVSSVDVCKVDDSEWGLLSLKN